MDASNRLSISEVARASGVNLQTIRFYEREGLIAEPPRSASGYRLFAAEVVRRVRFIKRAQELGFHLAEIKDLLALRVDPDTDCREIRGRAEAKLGDIDRKITDLRRMRKALARLTAACPGRGAAGDCPILDNLEFDSDARPSARTSRRNRRRLE